MNRETWKKVYITRNFIVSAVPADGLAPLGARSFAGTVMTKDFHTYKTSTWTAKTVSKPVILSS